MRKAQKLRCSFTQSEQGIDFPTPLPSSLLLGHEDAQPLLLCSLPLPPSSPVVCFLSLFSQPCHHSLMLVASFSPPSRSRFLSPCRLPRSHGLVISLTLHASSTVQAACYQQRHTHIHTDSPTHTQTDSCRQCFTLSLLPLSSTRNEITRSAVIFLMSCTQRKKND